MNYGSVTRMQPDANANSRMIRDELKRIIDSPGFEDSDRLIRFLTFVVEETLAGRGGVLKESLVGVEVFGRTPGYDPRVDPIVRVQARRLRTKLEAWYAAGGQASAVRISLPKGGYLPEFSLPAVAEPETVVEAPRKRSAAWRLATGAAAFLILATAAIVATRPAAKPATAGSRLFTAYRGYQTSPAFSPDGRTLAFSWGGPAGDNMDIYVQALDADTPRRLTTAPERDRNPVWLPDGQHIGVVRDDGPDRFAVMVVSTLGVGERRVAEIRGSTDAPPGIEWSRDGKEVYTSEAASPGEPLRIVAIDLATGARRELVPPATRGLAAGIPGDDKVALSPDGKWLAFRRRTGLVVADVFIASSKGGEVRAITHDRTGISGFAWSRDGRSLIVSSQRQSSLVRLWRFPIDGQSPVCLSDAVLSASYPAVSPLDGGIAFASRFLDTDVWRIDLEGKTRPMRLIASNLLDSSSRYSPDGKRIVFRSNRTGSDEIWTVDASGNSPVKLTNFGGPVTGSPRWAPDGRSVVFDSRPDGSADIFMVPEGGGRVQKLTAESSNEVTPSFSADGKSIYFASDRTGSWQIWKQPVGGGGARRITVNGGFAPQESADGRWLYYVKRNAKGLFRMPVSGGTEAVVLESLPPELWGGWAVTSDKVLFVALRGGDEKGPADLRMLDVGQGTVRTVSELGFPPARWDESVAVSPDGRYALVTELEREGSEIHLQADR